jgi:N-ethylmaleimide reductase
MNKPNPSAPPVLQPYQLGALTLPNRVVMSAMTRGRSTNPELVPTELDIQYYTQRASAGLIVTGGTWVNKQGIGYPNVPGLFSNQQTEAWSAITTAVHERGGRIFAQLGHLGALSHLALLGGKQPVGPSVVDMRAKIFVNGGLEDASIARALTIDEIHHTISDYARAARNAKSAGFDGVEVHAQANHLLPQFLNESINHRQDAYGGTIENRARIVLEVLTNIVDVWGAGRVGLKITPVATGIGALTATDTTLATYEYLVDRLNDFGLSHLNVGHLANFDLSGTPLAAINGRVFEHFRARFNGTLLIGGGFDFASANRAIEDGLTDLVAFAKVYISNPDLVERFARHLPLADSDPTTYYQGGAGGYIDYPTAIPAAV